LRKRQQIDSAREDVFAYVARVDVEAGPVEFVVQLGVDKVDLTEIGLVRVLRDAGEMLNGDARMRVAFNAESFKQTDLELRLLAEPVAAIAADGDNGRGQGALTTGSNATAMSGRRNGIS
jgi:hypothetical protein